MIRWRKLLVWTLLIFSAGCDGFVTRYGETDGYGGRKSLNGMAAMRKAIEQVPVAGSASSPVSEMKTREIFRLSPRTYSQDAIVWVPRSWPVYNTAEVVAWIDDWLSLGNRTLVFVVPDSGSTAVYWDEVVDLAPPEQRLEIRRRRAWEVHERLLQQSRRRDVTLHPYFDAKALDVPVRLGDRRAIQYDLQPVDPSVKPTGAHSGIMHGPGGFPMSSADTLVLDEDAFDEPVRFSSLVTAEGTDDRKLTLLAKLQHPRWPGSQILVIAGGGLVTNFAMTAPPARQLVARVGRVVVETGQRRIEAEASDEETVQVSFLSSEQGLIPVSDTVPNTARPRGMEFLTTWPISLVLIHAMFLGVVLCLMLLPIFGRPRRLATAASSNFGSHLNAVALLMQRAGGRSEAHRRISDYLQTVRGETSGPWIMPSSQPTDSRSNSTEPQLNTGEPQPNTGEPQPNASEPQQNTSEPQPDATAWQANETDRLASDTATSLPERDERRSEDVRFQTPASSKKDRSRADSAPIKDGPG